VRARFWHVFSAVSARTGFESSTGVCQQDIEMYSEFRGWESWIRIEPCAWRRSRRFDGCLMKSGGCGSPPDAKTPSV
jgi:hypothetical protein